MKSQSVIGGIEKLSQLSLDFHNDLMIFLSALRKARSCWTHLAAVGPSR